MANTVCQERPGSSGVTNNPEISMFMLRDQSWLVEGSSVHNGCPSLCVLVAVLWETGGIVKEVIKDSLISRLFTKVRDKVEGNQQKKVLTLGPMIAENVKRLNATQEEVEIFGRRIQPAHGDLEGREWKNKYPNTTLLLPSDLWPVPFVTQTQPEDRGQGIWSHRPQKATFQGIEYHG